MQENKKKLFAYCRVSTKKQTKAGTIENQERGIKRFVKYHQDKFELAHIFKDEGISASKERPAYNEMMRRIENKEADGIIIKSLDRIGRSVRQLSNLVYKLDQIGKLFIATDQNLDTSTKEGRLMVNLLASIAEYEAELIKERTQEGIERYVEDGGKLGRKKIKIPKKIKKKMIVWYEFGLGYSIISNLLKMQISEKFPNGINLSPKTVGKRLKSWNVKIRSPNHRKKGKKIDYKEKEAH